MMKLHRKSASKVANNIGSAHKIEIYYWGVPPAPLRCAAVRLFAFSPRCAAG
jgi:hypothetical protein